MKYPMRFTLCRARDCTRKVPVDGNPLCTPHRKQAARGERMTPDAKRTSGKRGPKARKPRTLPGGLASVPLYRPRGAPKDLPRWAMIDESDLSLIGSLRWEVEARERTFYAKCATRGPHFGRRMHQVVMGEPPLDREDRSVLSIDHANGDGLDNRRENLRWATPAEQAANRRPRRPKARD